MSQTDQIPDTSDVTEGTYNRSLYHRASQVHQVNPYVCTVDKEVIPVSMEIDIGASLTIDSDNTGKDFKFWVHI